MRALVTLGLVTLLCLASIRGVVAYEVRSCDDPEDRLYDTVSCTRKRLRAALLETYGDPYPPPG